MKIALIHPPLDDPTLPYHSTAYLRGQLVHDGFHDVSVRDLNIEFVNYCLEEEVNKEFQNRITRRLDQLTAQGSLTFSQQEQFYALWAPQMIEHAALTNAVRTLRTAESFLDFDLYRESVETVRRHFRMLGGLCYPAEIWDFTLKSRGRYSIYYLDDLFNEELCRRICDPIERFFVDRCANDADLASSQLIGVSVVYDHQLLPALHLTRLMKRRWPECTFVLGGTAVTHSFKYLRNRSLLRQFFTVCDGIVIGEGETAISEIANIDAVLGRATHVPNLVTYDRKVDTLIVPNATHYENLASLGSPVFQCQWDLYLSPERGINYSPTRGCYWNRCTFCDYGLNSLSPTSPWRERPVDLVVRDLRRISREEQVRYVYFAVDVMAPAYLERLADAMRGAGLGIRWGAELRLEKVYSKNLCSKLAASGCVAISFGMESGSQRILDLINKGTKVDEMGQTVGNFGEAGIAVQLMAFTHFPGETDADRAETKRFLDLHNDHWSTGSPGRFVLTATSLIARNPSKFHLTIVEPKNADMPRALGYRVNGSPQSPAPLTDCADQGNTVFPGVYGRPWASGTDTFHSMIYYANYGRRFFRENAPDRPHEGSETKDRREVLARIVEVRCTLAQSYFDLKTIMQGRGEYSEHIHDLDDQSIEPTHRLFLEWQQRIPEVERQGTSGCWLLREGKCLKIDKRIYDILKRADSTKARVSDLCGQCSPEIQDQILQSLILLSNREYIRLKIPAGDKVCAMIPTEITGPRNSGAIGPHECDDWSIDS